MSLKLMLSYIITHSFLTHNPDHGTCWPSDQFMLRFIAAAVIFHLISESILNMRFLLLVMWLICYSLLSLEQEVSLNVVQLPSITMSSEVFLQVMKKKDAAAIIQIKVFLHQ